MSYLEFILLNLAIITIGPIISLRIHKIMIRLKLKNLIQEAKEEKLTDKLTKSGKTVFHTFRNYKKKKGNIRILI
jgi:hypothetical protein